MINLPAAEASSGSVIPYAIAIPGPATWVICGFRTPESKVVRVFPRIRALVGTTYLAGGTSNLRCGNRDYGYVHILIRHQREWEDDAFFSGENWRDLADLAIRAALADPDRVTYDPRRDTFCFSREIYLNDNRSGRAVQISRPNIIISRGNQNIITAIPKREQCKPGVAAD